MTVHVGIGSDIIHAHPNFDGAAWGKASDTDFLIFARAVEALDGGVFLNLGTAVTGPEVFLKALSMARNVARQRGGSLRNFTTAVFDLMDLPADWRSGPPSKEHPALLLSSLEDPALPDGGRRRPELLLLRRPPADRAEPLGRTGPSDGAPWRPVKPALSNAW